MRFFAVFAACCVALSWASEADWESYKQQFGKSYSPAEEAVRKAAFLEALEDVKDHNTNQRASGNLFEIGVNEFADMSPDEFKAKMTGLNVNASNTRSMGQVHVPSLEALPASVDWRTSGYVSPVKNQGGCGSCWSFSAVGALEGQYYRKTKKLVEFSEQQLVDCAKSYGNNGCSGGWMNNAFNYVKDKGIEARNVYPAYTATDTSGCRYDATKVVTKSTGVVNIASKSESALQDAVATVGPVSVAIDAGQRSFQLYKTGIYNDPLCSQKVNHGVLVVGYGTSNGVPYWLVKNSWGTTWGEQGCVRMARNLLNQCSIASYASYPVV